MGHGFLHSDSSLIAFSYFIMRKLFGGLVRKIWVKRYSGLENIPRTGPVIIAFNHQSYFDFLCFIAVSPRNIHFLSAEKFFSNLFWAPLMYLTGQIKVKRQEHDKRILHDIVFNHLGRGKILGIFPEGTRSPDREHMLNAFSGVAKYAIRSKVPVIPVGVRGTYEVMAKHEHKPRFHQVVEIHVGPPISFEEFHHTKLNRKAFKVLTDRIMIKIAELSGKKYLHVGKFD